MFVEITGEKLVGDGGGGGWKVWWVTPSPHPE